MTADERKPGRSTRAVHAGRPANPTRALVTPVFQTSTFRLRDAAEGARLAREEAPDRFYTRWGNPSVVEVERKVAALEDTEDAAAFASGMAAISTALLALLEPGDRVVAGRALYSGTYELLHTVLPRLGVPTSFVDATDPAALEQSLTPEVRVVYVETPSNPRLELTDLSAVAQAVSRLPRGLLFCDSTFAPPGCQRTSALGADLVIHSATKFLGGHSDLVAGVAAGPRRLLGPIRRMRRLLGGCLSPHDAFLLARGLSSLPMRVERQCRNALRLARHLAQHPQVRIVHYPGLEDYPQHALARRQMQGGFGAMIAFELEGGLEAGRRFVEGVRVATHAVSLGGVETLVAHPASTTHATLTPEERERARIGEGLVRVSVGVEDVEDLIADFERALDAAAGR